MNPQSLDTVIYTLCCTQYFFKKILMTKPISNQCSTYEKARWIVFTGKICEQHMWKSTFLCKDAGHRPASLPKMSLFRRCFSHSFLVKTNFLVSP